MAETAQVASPIWGNKAYQERARAAFPLLVRQAEAGKTLRYGDLACELGMPNARNLNFPLGAIGTTLKALAKRRQEDIPPLQCVVVNKNTGIPGDGIGWFMNENAFWRLSRTEKRRVVEGALARIYAYPFWREILAELELPPPPASVSDELLQAAALRGGGGEGPAHKALKEYVLRHSEILGLPARLSGRNEWPLPSGDSLDVGFEHADEWVAAEVKPADCPKEETLRGLFQCVKYVAVMEAKQAALAKRRAARCVLVLGGAMHPEVRATAVTLGIEVIESVQPVPLTPH